MTPEQLERFEANMLARTTESIRSQLIMETDATIGSPLRDELKKRESSEYACTCEG